MNKTTEPKIKKIQIFIAALLLLFFALSFAACGDREYSNSLDSGYGAEDAQDADEETHIDGTNADDTDKDPAEGYDEPITEEPAEPISENGQETSGNTGIPSASKNGEEESVLECTFSITCSTVFDNLDRLDPAKLEILPDDGVIYAPEIVEFEKGDTVFDVLVRETRAKKIHMEYSANPVLKSNYIEGINNLYEFDCGELSGWTYKINGQGVGLGSNNYILSDGDTVEWVYTCDQGRDVGVSD